MPLPAIRWRRVYPGKYRSLNCRYTVRSTQTHRPLWFGYFYSDDLLKVEVCLKNTAKEAKEACLTHAIINKVQKP